MHATAGDLKDKISSVINNELGIHFLQNIPGSPAFYNKMLYNLSWEERCQWLRSNPVTAAKHFDERVQKFMKHIILNKNLNPLCDIVDYKYWIEFQQRLSSHACVVQRRSHI